MGTSLLRALVLAGAQSRASAAARAIAFAKGEQDAAPVWSPNGKQIAFSSQSSSGQWQVYTLDANGGGRRLVSKGTLNYVDVAWSPNGQQIGYSGLTDGQVITSGHVYVVNANGTGQNPLTSGSGWYDEFFGWSPDGSSLYFDRVTNGDDAIFTMNGSGSDLHELTPSSGDDDYWAAWSPDGDEIAFSRTNPDSPSAGGEIWVMNQDGSGQRQLTANLDDNFGSAWAPDGKQIAFMSNKSGRYQIYLVSPSGGPLQQLTTAGGAAEPKWSPNGKEIAYEGLIDGNYQIFVMQANGSGKQQLTSGTYSSNTDPAWSPNGNQIAFLSTRDGGTDIYVMNADGSAQTRLT